MEDEDLKCVNPIGALVSYIASEINADTTMTLSDVQTYIETTLSNRFFVESTDFSTSCCPDCTTEEGESETSAYMIGQASVLEEYFDLLSTTDISIANCCSNFHSGLDAPGFTSLLAGDFVLLRNKCCVEGDRSWDNCLENFMSTVSSLYNHDESVHRTLSGNINPVQYILQQGLGEYGSINGESGLCSLVANAKLFTNPEHGFIFLMTVFQVGLVVSCGYCEANPKLVGLGDGYSYRMCFEEQHSIGLA